MLRAMASLSARWVIVLLVASLPATASAQLLQRSSDAVRGRYGASEPRGTSPPPRSASPRGGSGVVTSSPRAPSRGADPVQVDAPPPPRRTADRPTRIWQPWGGAPWAPRYGTSTAATIDATVDAPVVAPPPAARDPLYGGSAGVRVVGRIGLAPRETVAVRASPGTPVGARIVVVEEIEDAPRPVRGVVAFDAGYVLHGVARATLSARLELPPFVDVVLAYAGYLEPNDAGFDAIAIGRLGLGARLVDEEVAQLRIAVSARHFHDWLGPRFGVEALLGLDVEVYEATMLSLEGALGTLGETFSAQIRATIGVRLIPALELYAGYDHLVLQPFHTERSVVELGGPMLGLRAIIE